MKILPLIKIRDPRCEGSSKGKRKNVNKQARERHKHWPENETLKRSHNKIRTSPTSSRFFSSLSECCDADITNGGFQSSIDEHNTSTNLTATAFRSTATTATTPITKIIAVTSRATNYEILGDDTSSLGLTQATIISEPYFDAQTPRNVTGLVGKPLRFGRYPR